jgi:uncharacterized membrane protein
MWRGGEGARVCRVNSWLGGRGSRTTVVLMLLAVIGLAIGWSTKAACTQTYRTENGQVVLDWRDWRQYSDACYTDIIPLYGLERLQNGDLPYKTGWVEGDDARTRYMEYPVLTGMLQYGVMRVTKAFVGTTENPSPPEVVTYFTLMAIVLALAWLIAVRCTIPLAGRPWDVALMALSPLIMVHAFTNFDTLAVALACGGMLAWARREPALAGLLFGLGAAAKLYPVFILGALFVLCLRSDRMRPWWRAFVAAVLAWAAVNLPIALLYRPGWWEFFRLNSTRPADHDSIYNAISVFRGWQGFDGPLAYGQTPDKLNLVTFALFAVACAGVAVIGLSAPRRPRVASLAFLIVAAFLLTNKVWSPQYSLWLVPLAVLALPRWLPLLAWMAVDAYLWFPRMGYFLGMGAPGRGNTPERFLSVVLIRDLLVVMICALIVWSIYRPQADPVRAAGFDDPAGGPLDGSPDRRPRLRDLRLNSDEPKSSAPDSSGPNPSELSPSEPSSPESRHEDTGPTREPAARTGP